MSLAQLERQVAELRSLVRHRAGAPDNLLVIVRGDEIEASRCAEALARVPERFRQDVQLQIIRLPWLTGRNTDQSSTDAVRNTQSIDYIADTPAVLPQAEAPSAASATDASDAPAQAAPSVTARTRRRVRGLSTAEKSPSRRQSTIDRQAGGG